MILTKKATMTWASYEDQMKPGLVEERAIWCAEAAAAGKTDNQPEGITPTLTIRRWVDQTAVEEWKSFIEATARKWEANLISVVIEDI